jgi:tryptophan synthase alpha chain
MSATNSGAAAIEKAIRAANSNGRPALSAFLTAGFPDRANFAPLLRDVAAEADLVEVGVPFSDPMADGVTIQRSSRVALEDGVTLQWILDTVGQLPASSPLILMGYLNPFLAFGLERLAETAVKAGISGLIVPDLPYEECTPLREAADTAGLALIQLVTPVTPRERLATLCEASRGFVYAVTMTGTTGSKSSPARSDAPLDDYLQQVREASPLPVLAGFGIRSAEQLAQVGTRADGAIVGSALIETLERNEDPVAFLRSLRGGQVEGKGASS